jgi:branched-chain amino acid transport system substrate-binding protein
MRIFGGERPRTRSWAGVVRRLVLPLASMLVVSGAVASCSQAPSSSSAGQPAQSQASEPKGAPIVIGEIAPLSGPESAPGGEDIPNDWATWTNAHGGVAGHPVKVVFGDDHSTTALDSGLVESLVQSDHVDAFLAVGSADTEAMAYLAAHSIPVLQAPAGVTTSNTFPLTASQSAVNYGLIQSAKLGGAKKVGVMFCTVSSFCTSAVKPFEEAAQAQGLDHSFQVGISLESPNYTAPCFAAKDNHVEALFAEAAAQQVEQIAQECAAQGYNPIFLLDEVQASVSMNKVKALNGARDIITTFPWFENDTPATQAFQQAIDRYSPGLSSSANFGPVDALTWANAQAIGRAAVLGQVSKYPSGEEILTGLHKFKDETLGGLIAPVTYKASESSYTNCYFVVATKDGKWVAPNGYGPRCAPANSTS